MGAFVYNLTNDGHLVGDVVQSPINLETLSNGKWLLLDGRDMDRGVYPELSKYFPAGVFTGTARTLNNSPAAALIVSDGTNFLAASTAGAALIQTSADGISWNSGSNWGASATLGSMIVAGSRFVMVGGGPGGANPLSQPAVISTGGTAVNLANFSNWSICSGAAFTTGDTQVLAYGSTANAGSGRTVFIQSGAGTSISTLDDGSTAWTTRSHTTSRTKKAVVWTGQKFIVLCSDNYNIILTSSDGVTWAEQYVPQPLANNTFCENNAASDGNGTVVWTANQGGNAWPVVSKDHGVTWRKIAMEASSPWNMVVDGSSAANVNVYYLNGKFFWIRRNEHPSVYISSDGLSWFPEPMTLRGGVFPFIALSYKAGVYCGIQASTSAETWSEDMSKFRLPHSHGYSSAAGLVSGVLHNEYIKARSN